MSSKEYEGFIQDASKRHGVYQAPRPNDPERIRKLGDDDTLSKLGLTGKP